MKKYLSVILTVIMLLTMVTLPANAEETIKYEEDFVITADEVNGAAEMLETAQWRLEESSVSQGAFNGTAPAVTDGKLVLSEGDSVMFDWMEIPNIGTFDSAKTYTFEFDFSVTDDGDDGVVSVKNNREFYFAPGGYYNQIEAIDGRLRTGKAGNPSDYVDHSLNTIYHAKVDWKNDTITSTVTDSNNNVVNSGSRTSDDYKDITKNKEAMKHWAFRCEDGEIQIDNLSFTDGTTTFTDSFEYGTSRMTTMFQKEYWNVESPNYTHSVGVTMESPDIQNGALCLKEGESVAFTWTKIPDMAAFDTSKTYTLEFDVTITSDGDDGCLLEHGSWIREFFVAPGGWFNQIEFKDGNLRAGGDGSDLGSYSLNEKYSTTIAWSNQTITSTVKDSEGNVIKSGSRTNADYADMSKNNGIMNHWIFRCEDGEALMDNFSFTDGTTTFTDSFDYEPGFDNNNIDVFLASDLWDLETSDLPGEKDCSAPSLDNGKLIIDAKEAAVFNWNNIPGMPAFDSSTEYTFEFNVEMLTYDGSSGWISSRELYVAPGGYYNQLEFKDGQVKTGNSTYVDFDTTKPVHAKIVWKGDTITTTVSYAGGTSIQSASRTNNAYTDMTANSNTMQRWAFRCEDGKVALSNFSFTATPKEMETQSFAIDSTKNNVAYSADVTVAEGETAILSFDGGNLITFTDNKMKIGGTVAGSYPAGTYHVDVNLNFAQDNALVTVTLPDGGIVRRGDYNLLGGLTAASAITFSKTGACAIANETVSYPDVTVRSYELPSEPTKTEFEEKAYNLTSSFDSDAKTTRSFAWTAVSDFDNMAVVYAKADEFQDISKRTTVVAVKETPIEEANQAVIYYKADITGLEAGTSYTYMIGDITDDEWGTAYTFTTEGNNETEFSFVAVADTQGEEWAAGFRYSKAAIDMALTDAPDTKFLLHGGDVVEYGSTESQWNSFFDSVKGTVETLPMFATIGNHDTWGTDADSDLLFDLHFNHPNNGGKAALGDTTSDDFTVAAVQNLVKNADETIYSFDYGNVHVVVLNSGTFNSVDEDNELLEAQRAWLANDLANSDAAWTVALVHQGVYHRYNTAWYCNALQDVLEDNGVDLVLNGHEHIVKRTYPIKDAKIVSKANPDVITKGTGTVYSTLGSTSLAHDHLADSVEEMLMVNGLYNAQPTYTVVNVSEYELKLTIKTLNGFVVDSFTIVNDITRIDDVIIGEESATASKLTAGMEATVHFNYRSNTDASQSYTVMAAYYNGYEELITAQTIATGTATASEDYKINFTVPNNVTTAKNVKFFVWDSVENITPLTRAFEIE